MVLEVKERFELTTPPDISKAFLPIPETVFPEWVKFTDIGIKTVLVLS